MPIQLAKRSLNQQQPIKVNAIFWLRVSSQPYLPSLFKILIPSIAPYSSIPSAKKASFYIMQYAINQLLIRNPDMLAGNSLVMYPPADSGLVPLFNTAQCKLHNNDWRSHKLYEKAGIDSSIALPRHSDEQTDNIILYWPKSKVFGASTLNWLASGIQKPTQLWVLAANDAGGKSLGKPLEQQATDVTKHDLARKCSLWSGLLTPNEQYRWQDDISEFQYLDLAFKTYPGVFNAGKLDAGTQLLLDNIVLPKRGNLLDLACGSGVIGLTCKKKSPGLDISLCDIDSIALASAQLNADALELEANIYPADGFEQAKRYDRIVCNPPFHQGKGTDYAFADTLLKKAAQHLKQNGELWIVANRHLAYEQWAEPVAKNIESIAQGNGFKVLRITY